MKYNTLGMTDLKVSLICLGTMTFGEQNSEAEAFEQMDFATSNGINFFDTAELYAVPPRAETYGRTEEIIGNWLQKSGKRKDVVLATKVVGAAGHMKWIRGGEARLNRAQITTALDASLARLQTDYIDLYQIHWPQRPVNSFGKLGYDQFNVSGREADVLLETLQTLGDAVQSGKIRHIGLSNETPWGVMKYLELAAAHNLPRVQSIQNPYSFLNRSFEIGLAEMALQEKVGLLAYAPLAAGTLTGKYLDGKLPEGSRRAIDNRPSRYDRKGVDDIVRGYIDLAARHELDVAVMAHAFVNTRPFLTSNIIGATRVDHIKTALSSLDVTLPAELLADIDALHIRHPIPCP
jgi:aryl-alcohol dehydrogenase-like predicted oxidoreductase